MFEFTNENSCVFIAKWYIYKIYDLLQLIYIHMSSVRR